MTVQAINESLKVRNPAGGSFKMTGEHTSGIKLSQSMRAKEIWCSYKSQKVQARSKLAGVGRERGGELELLRRRRPGS